MTHRSTHVELMSPDSYHCKEIHMDIVLCNDSPEHAERLYLHIYEKLDIKYFS